MRQRLKQWIFALLGKDPEAVVVSFCSGDPALAERMAAEVRELVPGRRHYVVKPRAGSAFRIWLDLRREFRHLRIGLAPVLFTAEPSPLRLAAFLLAPRKILAFNARLERHHLRLGTWIASLLFLRGVPVDRIWLRPFKRGGSVVPSEVRVIDGRPLTPGRPRVAVVSPYFPWPLSHGGAVRIFHLLREAAREFDVFLFAFTDGQTEADYAPVAEFCAKLVLAGRPRYREPRWSTLLPPEVHEFESPALRDALARFRREFDIRAVQVEYTQLARYGGDILVEHDVTYDLFNQVRERNRTLAAWWDYFRWHRFERRALRRFPHVVVMSEKDRALAGTGEIIENGVDLDRFRPVPEPAGRRLLFIGSFRHFPNVAAFRFFTGAGLAAAARSRHSRHHRLRPRPPHLLAGLHRPTRAAGGRPHHVARLRRRRAPALRADQPRDRSHHGLRRHQRQGARGDGDGARGGFHLPPAARASASSTAAASGSPTRPKTSPPASRGSSKIRRPAPPWPAPPASTPNGTSTGAPSAKSSAPFSAAR